MLFSLTAAFALLLLAQSAAVPQPSTNQAPAVVTPPPVDPATSAFTTDAGVLLVAIKPAAIADYELVIRTLQEALSKDPDPARRAVAGGWRVFKAGEPDAKGNSLYVHLMLPAIPGFDYRPSFLIDALVNELPPELLSRYQDSFAGPPSKLNLTELANMSVAPLPLPPAEPKKPGGRE